MIRVISAFADTAIVTAEAFVVHRGRRSQCVKAPVGSRAGILQSIGANLAWEYEFSLRYWIDPSSVGMVRLGIDPLGGSDPTAKSVAWSIGRVPGATAVPRSPRVPVHLQPVTLSAFFR